MTTKPRPLLRQDSGGEGVDRRCAMGPSQVVAGPTLNRSFTHRRNSCLPVRIAHSDPTKVIERQTHFEEHRCYLRTAPLRILSPAP